MQVSTFLVNRAAIQEAKWISETLPDTLAEGEVLLRHDLFSFTANNISYALTGDALGYWQFFPSSEAGWGKIPVWGFATVEASAHTEVRVGERFFGYFAPSSHTLLRPARVKAHGFVDSSPHRAQLPPAYNYYYNIAQDGFYHPDTEAWQAIFRPLFITSFLLDDFLTENDYFGARQVALVSASSKTGYGLGFLLHLHKAANITLTGLTSASNQDFVERLEILDHTIVYDSLAEMPLLDTCVVDFSGNKHLQAALEAHLGAHLRYTCLVGASHWDNTQAEVRLKQKGKFFFAPAQMQKRVQEWGNEALQQKIAASWHQLTQRLVDWTRVEQGSNREAFLQTYQTLVAGKYPADSGYIFIP